MERLAIFGPIRNRRGAELKVMSAVEAKEPGNFTRNEREHQSRKYWGTDTLLLSDTELAYALGRDGTTRRKLARYISTVVSTVTSTVTSTGISTVISTCIYTVISTCISTVISTSIYTVKSTGISTVTFTGISTCVSTVNNFKT
jgi:1,2-phenylacetyl-CoA epoxidase PaaB subunit